MKISTALLIFLFVSVVVVGYMFFRIARYHKRTQWGICILALIILSATTFLKFYIRQPQSWTHYVYIQWWLFANVFVVVLSSPVGFAALLARSRMPDFWDRHRRGITATALMFGFMPALWLAYGAIYQRYDYEVVNVELAFNDLPPSFDGYKIGVIADTHLGSLWGDTAKLSPAIDSINAHKPDVVVFLGDVVNNYAAEANGFENLFQRISAKQKFAILGNHDVGGYVDWENATDSVENSVKITAKIADFGFDLLQNKYRYLTCDNDSLLLLGTDYGFRGYRLKKDTAALRHHFCIWLSHSPEFWLWTRGHLKANFRLTLAGHTHGGQVGLRWKEKVLSVAKLVFPYDAGLFENKGDYLYVNSGLGVNGLPLRLGIRPEITVIKLKVER